MCMYECFLTVFLLLFVIACIKCFLGPLYPTILFWFCYLTIKYFVYGYFILPVEGLPWGAITLFSLGFALLLCCICVHEVVFNVRFLLTFFFLIILLFLFGNLYIIFCIFGVWKFLWTFFFFFNFVFWGFMVLLLKRVMAFFVCFLLELNLIVFCYTGFYTTFLVFFLVICGVFFVIYFCLYFYFKFR